MEDIDTSLIEKEMDEYLVSEKKKLTKKEEKFLLSMMLLRCYGYEFKNKRVQAKFEKVIFG